MPEVTVHLGEEDDYELIHRDGPGSEGYSVLKISDCYDTVYGNKFEGSKLEIFSSDGFETFIKKVSQLWAQGGGKISGRPDDTGA